MAQEWKFARRQKECGSCSRAFAEAEKHFSALEVAEGELTRSDLCRGCFEGRGEERPWLWWRTIHDPGRKRGLALDLELIERLFGQLEERAEENLLELRYVLCLLLMRKRRLRIVRTLRDAEGEAFLVRRPRTAEEHRVRVFDLDPERIDELRGRLSAVLEGAGAEDEPGEQDHPRAGETPEAGEAAEGPDGPEGRPRDPEPALAPRDGAD